MDIGIAGEFRLGTGDDEIVIPNGATFEGLNYLLNAAFRGGAQVPVWSLGYIDSAGFTSVSPNDTYGTHPGWQETFLGLPTTGRASWTPQPAAGGKIEGGNNKVDLGSLSLPAASIRGVFLTSSRGASFTGVIFATAVLPAAQSINSINYAYGITLTPRS